MQQLAGIAGGIGGMGGTSSGTTTTSTQASPFTSLLGAGIAGAGMYFNPTSAFGGGLNAMGPIQQYNAGFSGMPQMQNGFPIYGPGR
jgi:hypothetical protein